MLINRYNIHFYENKLIQVDSVYKAGFNMQKQPRNSSQHSKRDSHDKEFIDYFKESQENYGENNQKSIKK